MQKSYIEERNGGLYVTGKRVSLDSVVYGFNRGDAPESIQQSFSSLTLEEVYGAITYYLAHKAEVDAYLEREEKEYEGFTEERRRAHPELYAKLDALRQPQ